MKAKQRYCVTYCIDHNEDYHCQYFDIAAEAEAFASAIVSSGKTFHGAAQVELQEAGLYDNTLPLSLTWDVIEVREVTHAGISPIL